LLEKQLNAWQKGEKSLSALASHYEVHPNQIRTWKKRLFEEVSGIFSDKRRKEKQTEEGDKAKLFEEIGRLKIENDWLKKKLDLTVNEKREAIDQENKEISVSRQCELLGLSRSAYYYKAKKVNTRNLLIIRSGVFQTSCLVS